MFLSEDVVTKIGDVGTGAGATLTLASAGAVTFIESHPVFIGAVGVALGLIVQIASMIVSVKERRKLRKQKVIEQLKIEAAAKQITVDQLIEKLDEKEGAD